MSRGKATSFALALVCAALIPARAAWPLDADEASGFERTPPRLASTDGEVSFFRPGAGEWAPARVNTPLAAGDQLFTGDDANLELQVGAGAFVRAGEDTQLGLTTLEPDFLQLRLTEGRISLDLRSRRASQTYEIDTPNAAFTIERNGYYRVEVDGDTTTFTARRGGRATVTPASGDPAAIAPSEQVAVTGEDDPEVETWAAPELDAWDRWNYARSDDQMDAVSARYVPAGVSGVDELDHYGDWRVVSTYGPVWVPRRVAVGWVPYSTGRWLYDPYYGWTWVDDAPWGWAPYHYGRWVYVSGHWGWCPGRVVVRPYYAPALVAFYGGGVTIGVVHRPPSLGWVALGWGEPLVPWWGPPRFRSAPRWAGWGGPRIVNEVVVQHQTVINVNQINVYQNAHVHHAIVSVDRDHFGRRSGHEPRFARAEAGRFKPLHDLRVDPDHTSLVAATGPARRPSREALQRSVVATREPRMHRGPMAKEPGAERPKGARPREASPDLPLAEPPVRVVQPPRTGRRIEASGRPPFGRGGEAERRIPPPAPRFATERERPNARAERDERPQPGPERVEPQPSRPERGERPPMQADRGRPERGRQRSVEAIATPREGPAAEAERMPQAPVRTEPMPEIRRSEPRRGRMEVGRPAQEASSPRQPEASPSAPALPGEPANRLYRQRVDRGHAGRGRPVIAPQSGEALETQAPRLDAGDPQGRGPRRR